MAQAAPDRLSDRAPGLPAETRNLRFSIAGPADETDLRRLLRTTPVPGWVSLSYEREPDYFRAAAIEGDIHETLIGRDKSGGDLVVMASRSVRDAWIDERPARLGYLGELRLATSHQSRPWPVLQGYRCIRRLVEDGPPADLHVTSIVSSNLRARRLLTSGARDLPTYRPLGGFWTLALPCRPRRSLSDGSINVIGGTRSHREEITDFLAEQNARFQFAPRWSYKDLWGGRRCPCLAVEDFLLAYRRGRLVGCLAVWDQTPFKQYVVRGYGRALAMTRPIASMAAAALGWPRLPPVGSELRQGSLSHLAIRDNEPRVLNAVLRAALDRAARQGLVIATLGLGESHPLFTAARTGFRHLAYRSDIYLVHWDIDDRVAMALDRRPIQLEAAIL